MFPKQTGFFFHCSHAAHGVQSTFLVHPLHWLSTGMAMPALVPEWETRYQSVDSMSNCFVASQQAACSELIGIPDIIITNAMVLIRNLRPHDKKLPKCSDPFQFLQAIQSTLKARNQRDPNQIHPLSQYQEVPPAKQESTTRLLQKHLSNF